MAQMLRKLLQPRFSAEKLKPHAKMAMHRFQIVNSKKATAIKAQKKEIAALLAEGKVEKARTCDAAENVWAKSGWTDRMECVRINAAVQEALLTVASEDNGLHAACA